jgi:hypothetical protein
MSNEPQPHPPPTQFGVFCPLGHVAVALRLHDDAELSSCANCSSTAAMMNAM